MKYIVSFTTSPCRISKCQPMLDSILNQTRKPDLIILNIPKIFSRTGESYVVPENISENVVVNIIEDDLGPATKIVPTVAYLNKLNYDKDSTRIIYLDDDIKYMEKMIETYEMVISKNDNSVWCASGFDFINFQINAQRNHYLNTTIAEGYGGVCVKLSIFEEDFDDYIKSNINDVDCRLSDDIILSNYYHKKRVNIKVINIINQYSITDVWNNKTKYILDYGNNEDALHNGASGTSENNVNRYKKVIGKLSKNKERFFKIGFYFQGKITYK